jgi:hypothetical protein
MSTLIFMKQNVPPTIGSMFNLTATRGIGLQAVKSRRKPVNKINSPALNKVRTIFGQASTAWQTLTAAQQMDWDTFSAENPRQDAIGLYQLINGKTMFSSVFQNRLFCGNFVPPFAPVSTSTSTPGLLTFSVTFPNIIVLTFDGLAPSVDFIAVSLTRAQSLGAQAARDFALMQIVPGNTSYLSVNFDLWQARFGNMPQHGRIFAKCVSYNSDGWKGDTVLKPADIS